MSLSTESRKILYGLRWACFSSLISHHLFWAVIMLKYLSSLEHILFFYTSLFLFIFFPSFFPNFSGKLPILQDSPFSHVAINFPLSTALVPYFGFWYTGLTCFAETSSHCRPETKLGLWLESGNLTGKLIPSLI